MRALTILLLAVLISLLHAGSASALDRFERELYDAATYGDAVKAAAIIKTRPGIINVRTKTGETPLHRASANGHYNVVRVLCNHGAMINPRDNKNETPLTKALHHNHKKITQYLIKRGGVR